MKIVEKVDFVSFWHQNFWSVPESRDSLGCGRKQIPLGQAKGKGCGRCCVGFERESSDVRVWGFLES